MALFYEGLHVAELLPHLLTEENGSGPAQDCEDNQSDDHGTLPKRLAI